METKQYTKTAIKVLIGAVSAVALSMIALFGLSLSRKPVTQPIVTLNNDRLSVTIEIPEASIETIVQDEISYSRYSLENTPTLYNGNPGEPGVPSFREFIAIPSNATNISISTGKVTYGPFNDINLYPVPAQKYPDIDPDNTGPIPFIEEEFTKDNIAYTLDTYSPTETVAIEQDGFIRSQRVLALTVTPFQYNPVDRVLMQAVGDIDVTVSFDLDKTLPEKTQELGGFHDVLEGLVTNDNDVGKKGDSPATGSVTYLDQADLMTSQDINYLIITHSDFYPEAGVQEYLTDFANYRADTDTFDVGIANVDDIYAVFTTGENDERIQSFVDYAYHNWTTAPEYLLLMGDRGPDGGVWIPVHSEQGSGSPPSWYVAENDDWFAYVEGNDAWADLAVGRLSIRSVDHISNILDKIQHYENDPIDQGHYTRSMLYDGASVAEPLLDMAGQETIYSADCSMTPEFIQDFYGTFAFYHGHGYVSGWDGCFQIDDIGSFTNTYQTPIVMTSSCMTAEINWEGSPAVNGNSFGEAIVNQAETGAVAYYGSTRVGDVIAHKQTLYALSNVFDGFEYRLGHAITGAEILFTQDPVVIQGGAGDNARYYVLIGDPALQAFSYREPDNQIDLAVGSTDVEFDRTTDDVSVTVTNLGDVTATNVAVSVSLYETLDLTNPVAVYNYYNATIPADGSAIVGETEPTVPDGDYYFIARVDPSDAIAESFELNNQNGQLINTRPESTITYLDNGVPKAGILIRAWSDTWGFLGQQTTLADGKAYFSIPYGTIATFWAYDGDESTCLTDETGFVTTPYDATLERSTDEPSHVYFRDENDDPVIGAQVDVQHVESSTNACSGDQTGDALELAPGLVVKAWIEHLYWTDIFTTPDDITYCVNGCGSSGGKDFPLPQDAGPQLEL